jgi:hypothetical protein
MPMRYRTTIEACPCADHFLQGGCYGKTATLCRHLLCPDPSTGQKNTIMLDKNRQRVGLFQA